MYMLYRAIASPKGRVFGIPKVFGPYVCFLWIPFDLDRLNL